jgi:hypothetical protein
VLKLGSGVGVGTRIKGARVGVGAEAGVDVGICVGCSS